MHIGRGLQKIILGGIFQYFLKIGVMFHIPRMNVLWHGSLSEDPMTTAAKPSYVTTKTSLKPSSSRAQAFQAIASPHTRAMFQRNPLRELLLVNLVESWIPL